MRPKVIVLKRFALALGLWAVLTGGDPSAWLVGVMAAIAATYMSLELLPPRAHGVRLAVVIALAPAFLWDSLRGGLDVARRALHPRLPLRPVWLAYPVRLPAGAARVSLGNMLSLMPGTLAAGTQRDELCVHCLDGTMSVEAQLAMEEARIARSLGLELGARNG
jgi:multicomponent Na+:H+ antiporter subunit E